MAAAVEEAVFNALRGHHNEKTKLPTPRIIKIYVASLKEDFKEERRQLLEVIGPDLQSVYDDRQIEVEFVDIHFGTGSNEHGLVDLDPYVLDDHLHEIETCHRVSKSVFLIVLLGSRLGNFLLPTRLDAEVFTAISKRATAGECDRLQKWYHQEERDPSGGFVLQTQYRVSQGGLTCSKENVLAIFRHWETETTGTTESGRVEQIKATLTEALPDDNRETLTSLDRQEWIAESRQLSEILECKIDEILEAFQDDGGGGGGGGGLDGLTIIDSERFCDNLKRLKTRALEWEIQKGLACSKENVLAIFRHWETETTGTTESGRVEQIKATLTEALPDDNRETLTVPWAKGGIDPELDSHERYLGRFKSRVYEKLQRAIDQSLSKEPNGGKGRKKTVQILQNESFFDELIPWAKGGIDPELDSHERYLGRFKSRVYEKLQRAIDQSLSKEPNGGKGRKKTVQLFLLGSLNAHVYSIIITEILAVVPWAKGGIDPELDSHERYLGRFKSRVYEKLQRAIDQSLSKEPNGGKGRKKTVQEIFHEHSTHLIYLNEHLSANKYISSKIPDRIRQNVQQNFRGGSRHPPYFLHGGHGSGKSTLLSHIYSQVSDWFEHVKVHRLIRYAAATPRSAYNLELLRVICQQLAIILNIPEGYLPKDASFDPLYINNWFQNLLKHCEDLHNEILFLFIDDLHKLNPLDCDIVAALSWLPISLPWNVFLVVSTTVPIESLKLTPIQKERFKYSDYFYDLSLEQNETLVRKVNESESFEEYVNGIFDVMEHRFGVKGFSRLAIYITCSEYGLTETEFLELLMPTQDSEAFIDSRNGGFNFSTFLTARNVMRPLLREKLMSGKLLIVWRHGLCSDITKVRYMTPEISRAVHSEIVNLFFPPDSDESDEISSEQHSRKSSIQTQQDDNVTQIITLGPDISYSIRHVEESWHHLIKSDDTKKLKEIAVCNFDFLLAAVQTVSISYLRCLIEHVRCYILDRDIELVYYTIRKSSDVLTRDPMQLGAQLISWLKSVAAHEGPQALLSVTVQSATAWCDGYTVPLLVPLTGWLPVPLPSQIRCMTVPGPGPVRCIEVSPSKQHLILSPKVGDPQLWHIMSNSLVHTFKGHSGPVTYMKVQSQYLLTASEDTSVIVWDMQTLAMKLRLCEHIAPAACVTLALDNKYIISCSDDSSIIIALFESGKVVTKIDHHRGPVTAVHVAMPSEVLVSSSHDGTVCLWSLENFSLLNCIQLPHPVHNIQISCDSIFLVAYCSDNGLYLRALATGTELHALKGHKTKPIRSDHNELSNIGPSNRIGLVEGRKEPKIAIVKFQAHSRNGKENAILDGVGTAHLFEEIQRRHPTRHISYGNLGTLDTPNPFITTPAEDWLARPLIDRDHHPTHFVGGERTEREIVHLLVPNC
ncbi:conserved hypothetical protein [Culex quinquefasciatus]|uniref:NWD1/2-like winged helix-turn-helix domain-containing protein n=1 Tax=Culex quinquefasciatus TaxID=7176 RepID=B0W5J9_CULQU|nr:conserved hypothetical protein [Culex quinquefasciatus]|eukprot:XP_001843983.1 conserved hypothetical protein [Culex quinquefasciatus]